MKNKLIQFREWIENNIASYKDGTLMSSRESLDGEYFYKECLKKFDETFNTSNKQTILVDDVLDSIINDLYTAFLQKKDMQECVSLSQHGWEVQLRLMQDMLARTMCFAHAKTLMLATLLESKGPQKQTMFKNCVLVLPEELCVMMEERIKYHATKEG